jgi:hypothetical protein
MERFVVLLFRIFNRLRMAKEADGFGFLSFRNEAFSWLRFAHVVFLVEEEISCPTRKHTLHNL